MVLSLYDEDMGLNFSVDRPCAETVADSACRRFGCFGKRGLAERLDLRP
jgi:hypothetical protein